MKDYENLKKKYGEAFAKFCRSAFPTILEEEGLLSEIIEENFAPNKYLYKDLVKEDWVEEFNNFIFHNYSFKTGNKIEIVDIQETPEELFQKAGYTLYKCETNEDVLSFKKYFRSDEKLCTFNDRHRIEENYIFFAVKNNVDEIRRENFLYPKRQDEYGTSVMSIQFSKRSNYISIKNRYNHSVDNPDSTFSNNLEFIQPGLTSSFVKYYNINPIIESDNEEDFHLKGYTWAGEFNDENEPVRYYKYNIEFGGSYYCPNNVVITNGWATHYDKDKYEVFGYFVLDKQSKTISSLNNDSFIKSIGKIEKVETRKLPNNEKLILITNDKKETTELIIDDLGQIVGYKNDFIKEIGDDFFSHISSLRTFEAKNLEKMGDDCVYYSANIETLNLPNLKEMGSCCFNTPENLKTLNLPELTKMGGSCFRHASRLRQVKLPNLVRLNVNCFEMAQSIETIDLPKLQLMRDNCFSYATNLTKINLDSLECMREGCFYQIPNVEELNLPNLQEIRQGALRLCDSLKKLNVPNLIKIYRYALNYLPNLEELNAPSLREISSHCFNDISSLKTLYLPKLEVIDDYCFSETTNLQTIQMDSLTELKSNSFNTVPNLEILSMENLKHIEYHCFNSASKIKEIILSSLEIMDLDVFSNTPLLERFEANSLQSMDSNCFTETPNLKYLSVPNIKHVKLSCFKNSGENILEVNAPSLDTMSGGFQLNRLKKEAKKNLSRLNISKKFSKLKKFFNVFKKQPNENQKDDESTFN